MITVDVDRLPLGSGCRILDIGCGSGRHVAAFARFADVFVVGGDRQWSDLKQCRERMGIEEQMGTVRGRWALAGADALHLPFSDGAFDLVVCAEVLEHIRDHRTAASELSRVLKPGRHLVVSVPRYFPEKVCWRFSDAYRNAGGGHVRIYREYDLVRLLGRFGLVARRRHFAHALHSPYWWLKCLTGPERKDVLPVALYHRLLVWDMMKKPKLTRALERLLNPVLGKSLVLYLQKEAT